MGSGYYRWVNAFDVREEREKKDREDFERILKAYNQRGYSKGARGIYMCMVLGSTDCDECEKDQAADG